MPIVPRFGVELVDRRAQTLEGLGVVELALHEADALEQLLPRLVAELGAGVLLDRVVDDLGEVLVLPVATGEADQGEPRGQQTAVGEVVYRRHELFARQVAGDAEDHQGTGPGDPAQTAILGIAEGIVTRCDLYDHVLLCRLEE